MAYQIREGQGSLFPADKRGNDKAPDYSGKVRIGGTLYRLAGWKRTTADHKAWLSLAIEPDQRATGAAQARTAASASVPAEPDFDDDIPF